MEDAGQKLKRVRDRLDLTSRDVEEASREIANRHGNQEFVIVISRLSEIENKGTIPTMYRLYSLCAIYRLEFYDVLQWYGVDLAAMPADAARIRVPKTHSIGFKPTDYGEVQMPLSLDPGIDLRRTTFLSRMIQRWGRLPASLLGSMDLADHRYAYIGSNDWRMYPLIHPGSLVLIDESKRKIVNLGWTTEFDRPIYFFECRDGFICAWCTLNEDRLIIQPHPASMCVSEVYPVNEVDVLGQVSGVAMRLDQTKRRRTRS